MLVCGKALFDCLRRFTLIIYVLCVCVCDVPLRLRMSLRFYRFCECSF